MRNMLAHYIITMNDLARMLRYHVLDRDLSKGIDIILRVPGLETARAAPYVQ